MIENEIVTPQIVKSLSVVAENGINASAISDWLNTTIANKEYSEQQSILFNTILLANTISQEATKCMHNLSEQREKTMMDLYCKLAAQQAAPQRVVKVAPKKQIFTPSEVMKIANIKGKNTVNKYLNNGTIKGTQNPNSGRWFVKRQDLADYLGTDDF